MLFDYRKELRKDLGWRRGLHIGWRGRQLSVFVSPYHATVIYNGKIRFHRRFR